MRRHPSPETRGPVIGKQREDAPPRATPRPAWNPRRYRFPLALLFALPCAHTSAQTVSDDAGVLTRKRPEYAPSGLAVGPLRAFPTLQQRVIFDDNVFSTDGGDRSAFLFETSPAVALRSDWNRHGFGFDAYSNVGRNPSFPDEDFVDWAVGGNGRIDVSQRADVSAGISYGRDHVNRSAPNEERGLTPTEFDAGEAFLRYRQTAGRFDFLFSSRARLRDFDDVIALRNGNLFLLNQDDRDRTEITLGLRTRYRISAAVAAFLEPEFEIREYDEVQDVLLVERSSNGHELSGGFEFELGGHATGAVWLGYRLQDYDSPFPDISTPLFGVTGHWDVTALTALSLSAERQIAETQGNNFSGFVSTEIVVRVDHELLRNLLLNSEFRWMDDDYEGVAGAERSDTTYNVRVGANYLINRHMSVLMDYYYFKRDSIATVTEDMISGAVQKNLVILQLRLQL